MKFTTNHRLILSAYLIVFYFIPVIFFAVYSITQMSTSKSWSVLSTGLLLIAVCSLTFIVFLFNWEKRINIRPAFDSLTESEKETKVTSLDPKLLFDHSDSIQEQESLKVKETVKELNLIQVDLKESQEKIIRLQEELASKEQEFKVYTEENKLLSLKAEQIAQDYSDYKLFSEEQLKQKNLQLVALQQMIEDQRTEVEKRQEQIHQLDTKIHDLSYEIKTLLYLHETDSSPLSNPNLKIETTAKALVPNTLINPFGIFPQTDIAEEMGEENETLSVESQIRTSAEATALMRKCINVAQKLTGSNYYSNESSRFREFSSSHYTIDQRRLFDSLRSESSGLILVYSQKEHKLLFANNQIKHLLGCSPEKFVTDFSSFIQDGLNDWKKALSQLTNTPESQARLLAKTKQGHEIMLNCHFGVIPTGLFRNFVICVLYPT
jgi:hypothetical protein